MMALTSLLRRQDVMIEVFQDSIKRQSIFETYEFHNKRETVSPVDRFDEFAVVVIREATHTLSLHFLSEWRDSML